VTGSRGTACLLAVVLAACSSAPHVTSTSSPRASLAEEPAESREAVAAFLELMADPDLTYRVTGELRAGAEDPEGGPAIMVTSRYDIQGDDFGGQLSVRVLKLKYGSNFMLVRLDGKTDIFDWQSMTTASIENDEALRDPTAVSKLTADDLEFLGMTDDGLFEFQVRPWLAGDPIGDWVEAGVVPDDKLPRTELQSSDTRLLMDKAGVPQRLVTSWTFNVAGKSEPVAGQIVDEFSAFGLYVKLSVPNGFPMETSHDMIVGVDEDHVVITEPFAEVLPAGDAVANLDVRFRYPDQAVMLGIEGAIFFLRSLDADGEVIVDRIVQSPEATVAIPAGAQTLVAYYRPCDGNCGLLDGPQDFCAVEADIEPGRTYELIVAVQEPQSAVCTVDAP
jgi:hypothetical protein